MDHDATSHGFHVIQLQHSDEHVYADASIAVQSHVCLDISAVQAD